MFHPSLDGAWSENFKFGQHIVIIYPAWTEGKSGREDGVFIQRRVKIPEGEELYEGEERFIREEDPKIIEDLLIKLRDKLDKLPAYYFCFNENEEK